MPPGRKRTTPRDCLGIRTGSRRQRRVSSRPVGRRCCACGIDRTMATSPNKEETMRRGLISVNAHAVLEPIAALALIAGPWIFGFSDVGAATAVSIAVGGLMLVSGSMTRWRYSLIKVISLETHFAGDLILGAVLMLSPFVFGFIDEGGAARFTIIMGGLELLASLATRWEG